MHPTVVALDIGGSAVKSGRVRAGRPEGTVCVTPLVRDAPAEALVDAFARAVRVVAPDGPYAVAAAVPDPFDHAAGVSLMTHKLAALRGRPLGPLVAAALGRPVELRWCNDAAAAVAGEASSGAAAGHRRVLGITLGTGLGAALVVDGVPVPEVDGWVVGDLWRTALADGRTADAAFSARALLAAVDDGAVALRRFAAALGTLLVPVITAADADVVVVGGGGSGSFDTIGGALADAVGVPVVRATLGPWAALLGAVHLCRAVRSV